MRKRRGTGRAVRMAMVFSAAFAAAGLANTKEQINAAGAPDARFGATDPIFVTDLSAEWKATETVKLFGGAQNLLNEEYMVARHPHGPRPGSPLFAYAGVEARF